MQLLAKFGGVIEGAFLTVCRAISGTADVVSLGFSGKGLYSSRFPDFVWESHWFPVEKVVTIEKTVEKEKAASPEPSK